MKNVRFLWALLLLLSGSSFSMAQDNPLGSIMRTAQMQNEANNEQTNNESGEQNQWQEEWQKMMKQNGELLDAMDTKYLKCTAMMVLYVHAYLKLVNEHKIGEITMSACDAYGMQTLALAASTTIMYCPEEINGLNNDEQLRIISDLSQKLSGITPSNRIYNEQGQPSSLYGKLLWIIQQFRSGNIVYDDTINNDSELLEELEEFNNQHGDNAALRLVTMKYLIEFFRPRYIIPESLKIAQEMEALGCSG